MKTISRNGLKYIAIGAMLLDHAAEFYPKTSILYFCMRFLGRLTMPIMCFFIAEGYFFTSSKIRYGLRLGIFTLVSQLPYTYFHEGTLLTAKLFTDWNVIFTLFIGFCVLMVYDKIPNKIIRWIVIALLCAGSIIGDWRIITPMWILFFYIFRDSKKNLLVFGVLAVLEVLSCLPNIINDGQLWQVGVFLVIPLLYLYKGNSGSKNVFVKWAFYLFYPLHLLVLGLLK